MSRLHYFITLLFVVMVAAFANWLLHAIQQKTEQQATVLRHEPDYFADMVTARVFNADGSLHYRLQSRRLDHYPDDDTLHLLTPELELFTPEQAPWFLVAEEGIVHDDGQRIDLNGAVDIRQPGDERTATRLRTRDLRIDTRRDYAETDAAVELTRGYHRTTATGMRASLALGRLELLADTRGYYDVAHP